MNVWAVITKKNLTTEPEFIEWIATRSWQLLLIFLCTKYNEDTNITGDVLVAEKEENLH